MTGTGTVTLYHWSRRAAAGLGAAFCALFALAPVGSGLPRPQVVAVSGVFGLASLFFLRGLAIGVKCKAQGIVIRNVVSVHRVAWDDIVAFRLRPRGSMSGGQIVVVLKDGRELVIEGVEPGYFFPRRSTIAADFLLQLRDCLAAHGNTTRT
jgi:Bacterial PH domain